MALKETYSMEVLAATRRSLGLSSDSKEYIYTTNRELLATLIRYCAGYLCPCSAITLRRRMLESLRYLINDTDLDAQINDAIEGLLIGGDLLELNQTTTDDPSARGTWLFAAPPSFIIRPSGNIFLTGIVPDQDTYLPNDLLERVLYEGYTRMIEPNIDEDLASKLSDLGMQKLSEKVWLKSPRHRSPEDHYMTMKNELQSTIRSGTISDLEILDPEQSITYYRGRWANVRRQSGMYVGRRPQEYGASKWCFVDIEAGEAKKLLDLPLNRYRWRGCDAAWHLQMAIDYQREEPQQYRLSHYDDGVRVDFFSPIPIWAHRRLMIIGHSLVPERCLMSYWIPVREAEAEVQFLQKELYLSEQGK